MIDEKYKSSCIEMCIALATQYKTWKMESQVADWALEIMKEWSQMQSQLWHISQAQTFSFQVLNICNDFKATGSVTAEDCQSLKLETISSWLTDLKLPESIVEMLAHFISYYQRMWMDGNFRNVELEDWGEM